MQTFFRLNEIYRFYAQIRIVAESQWIECIQENAIYAHYSIFAKN